MAKKYAKSLLRVFKRSGFQSDRLAYIAAQKVYQSIIRKKKKGDQAGKKCVVSKHITDCEWYEHFKGVFNRSYTHRQWFFYLKKMILVVKTKI